MDEPCSLCGRYHKPSDPVVLHGREICTYSEEWRFECEVRYALALPDKARKPKITKMDYLNGVERERGHPERVRLREEMVRRYKK